MAFGLGIKTKTQSKHIDATTKSLNRYDWGFTF
jgi:hypothetical protein